jgi:hypothetical protein
MVRTVYFPFGVLNCPMVSIVTIFSFGVSVVIMFLPS